MEKTRDDFLIWSSFLSGDDHAYEYIYKQHIQKLFLYGKTLTSDEDLIQDCIQDVFIRLHKNRKYLGKTNNIRLYLLSALKNTILNAFRKQNRYNKFFKCIEDEDTIDSNTVIDQMIRQEDQTDQKKQIDFFWSVLTGRQKEVIYYRFVEGLSLSEIAKRLGIDYHSTANIIQRALRKMRKSYLISD